MTNASEFESNLAQIRLETIENLTVPEIMAMLGRVKGAMAQDQALSDLAEPVRSIIVELENRRQIAMEVAIQVDAENCPFKN